MSRTSAPAREGRDVTLWTRAALIALLAGASFAFSLAFACATPFAGLAGVAALRMKRADALLAVTVAWLANQANGFLFLHYPWTSSCIGWGLAIWVAALAAVYAAILPRRAASTWGARFMTATRALGCAFLAYEAALAAATLVLPSTSGAFSIAVVARLLAIDAAAFALLLAVIGAVSSRRIGASPGAVASAQAL